MSSLGDMADFVAAYPAEPRVRDPRVLAAMRKVPREEFVPAEVRHLAYRTRRWTSAKGRPSPNPSWWDS